MNVAQLHLFLQSGLNVKLLYFRAKYLIKIKINFQELHQKKIILPQAENLRTKIRSDLECNFMMKNIELRV